MDEENKNLPVPEDPEGPEEAKEPEKLENIVYDWARSLAAAVVSVVLLFAFGVRLIGVSGPSMQDTLYTGDRLVVLGLCSPASRRGTWWWSTTTTPS